ncbi:hypothetical protein QOZ80_3AG0211230 [Eleusine coracana subsp. coracana]|nr:hypothetical protein QOZ80_3AG0211230 [Eleusine coracana subsp. coracana]
MRFTDKKPEGHAFIRTTLQIFSVEVSRIKRDLQWPLHVYGMVALRDSVDDKRNIIFNRTRDNCQILTEEVSFLKLIGPSGVVALIDPVIFEVDLKVKGSTESGDKQLSFLAVPFMNTIPVYSCLLKRDYASKLSTMRFRLGLLIGSLEATIAVRVARGSWPDGCRVQFAVRTASISDEEAILLDSGDSKVPVDGDGNIMLSRCVACVELLGELRVSVKSWKGANNVVNDEEVFEPKEADRSYGMLDIGFCQMDVTVSWSLISSL